MSSLNNRFCRIGVFVAGMLMAVVASSSPIPPSGWACEGACGVGGIDGITAPSGGDYQWISTQGGFFGNASLTSPVFTAEAGTSLSFFYNVIMRGFLNSHADWQVTLYKQTTGEWFGIQWEGYSNVSSWGCDVIFGFCEDDGDWIAIDYVFGAAGNYMLEFSVSDLMGDSSLAISGLFQDDGQGASDSGAATAVPAPAVLGLFGFALVLIGLFARQRQ